MEMQIKVTTSRNTVAVLLAVVVLVISSKGGGGALGFKCSKEGATCNGLVGYKTSTDTTLSQIQSMFGVTTLHSLLGANNLTLTTPPSHEVRANETVRIPFRCRCSDGKGMPLQRLPIYTAVKDDGLWHIAAEVFSGVVTTQQIQEANNIPDPNLILQGQELWIPLPCSCDQIESNTTVIHYGHAVKTGSTVDEIAEQYGVANTTLLALNDLPSPQALLANTPLDVPLKACRTIVETDSLDYPLLVGDGTYAFTAGDCVVCKCDAASSNSTLQCEPSSISPSTIVGNSSLSPTWKTCPSMQCQGGDLYLGNTTTSTSSDSSSSSSCNVTTCSYAGYRNNQTILTTLSSHSTCAVSNKNRAWKVSVQGWSWGSLLVSLNLLVLCLVQY